MTEETSPTLKVWRLNWRPDEIEWRKGWQVERERRADERILRRKARARRDREYFGEELMGVSAKHRDATLRQDRLEALGLPVLRSEQDLADWLEIPLGRMRWFTHDKPADTTWHYVRHTVSKRSGGTRVILAPKTELKALQRKILYEMLNNVPVKPTAHGFVRGRSIVTNASPHTGKRFVMNLDLKDFFPSINLPRVRGLFISFGYGFAVASALAMLCTEYDREPFGRDGVTYYVSIGPRHLVQGAPPSPALANLVTRRLDTRLSGLAVKRGFTYTRYADDLTFSGNDYNTMLRILDVAQRIIGSESFEVNPAKTRIFRQSSRQVVTGLVVNDHANTPRELRRWVRAILHNARKTGLEAQNREGRENYRAYLQGIIGFIHEANPSHAKTLREQLRNLPD